LRTAITERLKIAPKQPLRPEAVVAQNKTLPKSKRRHRTYI